LSDDFQTSIEELEWRHIGPFNGGRGTSVVGHSTEPHVVYFGHGSGGLWKTEDAAVISVEWNQTIVDSYDKDDWQLEFRIGFFF